MTATTVTLQEARCVVCGGTSNDVVLRDNGYEGRACACGTIYMSPAPAASVDPTFLGHEDSFYDLAAPLKARWVRRHTTGSRLLEVGCGNGTFLVEARTAGFSVEGLEPEPGRAGQAEAILGGGIHREFLESFAADECGYDVVFHCDMLAHFDDPHRALRAMTELLAPGGVLAFEVGLLGEIPRYWYRTLTDVGFPHHRWLYSERSLRMLLTKSGLRIRTTRRFDLSLYLALGQAMRGAAAVKRAVRGSRSGTAATVSGPAARSTATHVPLESRPAYQRLQNFLRYRVGALLPPLGPATLLVIAEPV